jgi:uncharacterized protein
MKTFNLVLKLTERCNLNCSYCYYFNGIDQSFKEKPPTLKKDILEQIIVFLKKGIADFKIKKLGITFHGGEPLLIPKKIFKLICDRFYESLVPELLEFDLSIQTNGVLIDKEWIEIFEAYKIKVGISLDGPSYYNDIHRVDHKNRGSYDRVKKSINLLQASNYNFGILSVINPKYDPKILYDHFVNDLGVKGFDFLWPDFTHDKPLEFDASKYGKFINEILNCWVKDDNPEIQIRFLDSYLNKFLGSSGLIYGQGSGGTNDLHLIVIRSNGEISPTDELMSTDPKTVTSIHKDVFDTTLKEFFTLPIFAELNSAFSNAPDDCKNCCWEKVCGGGGIVNRFSKDRRFNNSSVYCEGLKLFHSEFLSYLIKSGVAVDQLKSELL